MPTEGSIMVFREHYFFLSNMSPSTVVWEGMEFPSVENAYQAAKLKDPLQRIPFQWMTSWAAKKASHQIKDLPENWHQGLKDEIMMNLLQQKFSWRRAQENLLNTGDCPIIHLNEHGDIYWGVVMDKRGNLKGENKQGKMIMEIRHRLKYGISLF